MVHAVYVLQIPLINLDNLSPVYLGFILKNILLYSKLFIMVRIPNSTKHVTLGLNFKISGRMFSITYSINSSFFFWLIAKIKFQTHYCFWVRKVIHHVLPEFLDLCVIIYYTKKQLIFYIYIYCFMIISSMVFKTNFLKRDCKIPNYRSIYLGTDSWVN